jgi:hypothetical protein
MPFYGEGGFTSIIAVCFSGATTDTEGMKLIFEVGISQEEAKQVFEDIKDTINVDTSGNTAYWIMGHGFGGAMSELLANHLLKFNDGSSRDGVPENRVLAFNFGGPPIFTFREVKDGLYSRIVKFYESNDRIATGALLGAARERYSISSNHYEFNYGDDINLWADVVDLLSKLNPFLNGGGEAVIEGMLGSVLEDLGQKVIGSNIPLPIFDYSALDGANSWGAYIAQLGTYIASYFKDIDNLKINHDLKGTYLAHMRLEYYKFIVVFDSVVVSYYTGKPLDGIHVTIKEFSEESGRPFQKHEPAYYTTNSAGAFQDVLFIGDYELEIFSTNNEYKRINYTTDNLYRIINHPFQRETFQLVAPTTTLPDGTKLKGTYIAAKPETGALTYSRFDFYENGEARVYLALNTQSYMTVYEINDGMLMFTPNDYNTNAYNVEILKAVEQGEELIVLGGELGMAYIKTELDEKAEVLYEIPTGIYRSSGIEAITGFSSFDFTGDKNVTLYMINDMMSYKGTYEIKDDPAANHATDSSTDSEDNKAQLFMFTSPSYPGTTINIPFKLISNESFSLGEQEFNRESTIK